MSEHSSPTDPHTHAPPAGRVALVGAGPGAVGLLTLRGAELLKTCDAVVYDALANSELLSMAPAQARRIDVGKRAGFHKKTQDQTNQILVDLATEGLHVVRLKGGDPYLFGRGSEEATFCARHHVEVEVVPGVTSGLAAPATAGIPVTHRGLSSSVTLITGHEDPQKVEAQGGELTVDYDALAKLVARGGTLCIYMGVSRIDSIADRLVTAGLPPATPAALVQWGTHPQQRQARGTLTTLAAEVERLNLAAPAIIVIGAVAALTDPGLDWFTRRPLAGQRIIVTRSRTHASTLRASLEAQGAQVLEAPTIRIEPPTDPQPLLDALVELPRFQWVIFTSANAVDAFAQGLDELGLLDPRRLAGLKIAAVADATAQALHDHFRLKPDVVPDQPTSLGLAEHLTTRFDLQARSILLPQADLAKPALRHLLTDAGADVTSVLAYRTVPVDHLDQTITTALRQREVDAVTFTSGSTVRNFLIALGPDARTQLQGIPLISIGPTTSKAITDARLTVHQEAAEPSIDALVEAVKASRLSSTSAG